MILLNTLQLIEHKSTRLILNQSFRQYCLLLPSSSPKQSRQLSVEKTNLIKPEAMSQDRSSLIIAEIACSAIEPTFSNNMGRIHRALKQLDAGAGRFDFNAKTPGNGYRSMIKIMESFARLVYRDLKTKNFTSVSPHLINMSQVFAKTLDHMVERDVLKNPSLMWSIDSEFIELAFTFEPFLHSFYAKNHNFWLCQSVRSILTNYISLIAYKSSTFCDMCRLFSRASQSKLFTDYAMNVSISFVRSVWGLSEIAFYRKLYPFLLYGTKPSKKKTLYSPRQQYAQIIGRDSLINYTPTARNTFDNKFPVRFRLLQETKNDFIPTTLIFHCHGAGFVAQSPESHEIYLRDWAIKLRGIPVVSVDYRLSPEHKFPAALQDCLDLYLWLTSGLDEVKEMLGFHPKRIILCGDSAGGGLCVSLTLVLNDLRAYTNVTMPSGLIPFYPVCCLQTAASPSRLFTFFDTFLPLGVLLAILDAYLLKGDTLTSIKTISDSKSNKPLNKTRTVYGPHSLSPPWYRNVSYKERLDLINNIAKDAFASPLNYGHFSSLTDVPLNILVGEFDPLLDEAIEFARLWKGDLKLLIQINDLFYKAKASRSYQKYSDLTRKSSSEHNARSYTRSS